MKILILDNYDSFTYNLVHLVEEISDNQVAVHRNDKITLEAVAAYDKIILSPGPGLPAESGILCDLIRSYAETIPILGVCLGAQAIGEVFGGRLMNLPKVAHGLSRNTIVLDKEEILFRHVPGTFKSGRYHSWAVSKDHFPECLKITAEDENGTIMAIRHKKYDICGVQFHPESVLTEYGHQILKNWLETGDEAR